MWLLVLFLLLLAGVLLPGCDIDRNEAPPAGQTPPSPRAQEQENTESEPATEKEPVRDNAPSGAQVSGRRAMEHVRNLVRYGERWPGSPGHFAAQEYIIRQLRLAYATVEEVEFVTKTPDGLLPMKNLIGKLPGSSSEIIVVAGHYDTLKMEGFVGANDGGSSTALLLELARVLGPRQPFPASVWLVFFDGEEALREWGESDGLYGSRYQVSAWQRSNVLDRVKAVIVLDMIGDQDLTLRRDQNSTDWLVALLWQVAREKGYGKYFLDETTAVEDDHVPFVRAGVPAVDVIDLQYGPGNGYWHTRADTPDKLSPRSFEVVGEVVLETIRRLAQRWPGE